MVKNIFTFCVVLFSSFFLHAQVSKGAVKAFNNAMEAYDAQDYQLAHSELDKALSKSPNYADAYLFKSQLYRDYMKDSLAIESLKKGLNIDDSKYQIGWFELAELCWGEGRYEEGKFAMELFKTTNAYDKFVSDSTTLKYYVRVKESLDFSLQQMSYAKKKFNAHRLSDNVNSQNPEYYPSLSLDSKVIIMTRRFKPISSKHEQEDFYISRWNNSSNSWSKSAPINGINTPYNEGAAAISGDGATIVFTACEALGVGYGERDGKGSCDLFESNFDHKTGSWSIGENLGEPNSKMWESQPTLSADGNFLVFARARHLRGMGSDLFGAYRKKDGSWSKPFRLPGEINTPFEEESPFLHPDGKTLYFSSNGHPGMGHLDLFVSHLGDDGNWGEPMNLGYPLNTHDDENSLIVEPSGDFALFATDRGREKGDLDLWRFGLNEDVKPDAIGVLSGVVVDNQTGKLLEASVVLLNSESGELVARVESGDDKGFVLPLPAEGRYSFEVDKEGYLFKLVDFQMRGLADQFVEVRLDRIEAGASIHLKTIRFETGSSELEKGYQADLVRLVNWLEENSNSNVEIIGHTDNVGSDKRNLILSSDRAKSVKSFLVTSQIDAQRLTTSGKGSKEPISTNESEEGRAENRRVEILIK